MNKMVKFYEYAQILLDEKTLKTRLQFLGLEKRDTENESMLSSSLKCAVSRNFIIFDFFQIKLIKSISLKLMKIKYLFRRSFSNELDLLDPKEHIVSH